ncbi:MAG: peptidoglycan -binding protein [Paracoccaceae bacterium]
MALSRRRDSNLIWPGFVDAVTTLLMVLMFILTIFTVMQSVLRDTITSQDNELSVLTDQVAALSQALGLEKKRAAGLETRIGDLQASLSTALASGVRQEGVIAGLRADLAAREGDLSAAAAKITAFETQVAALMSQRDAAEATALGLTATVADLQAAKAQLLTEAEAMQLALATARKEMDATVEAARLDAARREALEALVKDLQTKSASDAETAKLALSDAEAKRLADAAALQALRDKLAGADTELTAMTLALEAQRKRAEETLTLLAAARTEAAKGATTVGIKDAALVAAEQALLAEQDKVLAAAREMELLNQQIAALRSQLGSLQQVLDQAADKDAAAQVQLETLGSQLNAALAQVAVEQKARADLEAAEAARLAAENADLERFRSEFFGQLSTLLQGREGVRVVGDRFVFSSEVLFTAGSADLAPEGRAQIASVVQILDEVRAQIPDSIDWIIRVDGHTDNVPLSGTGEFVDNWQLSQARALSVVRFMQTDLGFPPDRLAATGFGEYRPVAAGNSAEARAQNRRIELKLTER